MMRACDAWQAMRALPVAEFPAALAAGAARQPGTVLVLAPHPDDESLGCGGLIATACASGMPPVVVILTDGCRSHPNSRTHPAERLRQLRESETMAAAKHLGLPEERIVFMGFADAAAPVAGPRFDDAVTALTMLIRDYGCPTVLTTWRHDPHCDHAAAAAIAAAACRITGAELFAYPVWGWTLPPETDLDQSEITGFRLDIAQHLDAKRAAILAHQSQHAGVITDDPSAFQMTQAFMERFLMPCEIYIRVAVSP